MGGKIAQIVGGRRPAGLRGLILVAPAPPTPMAMPDAQRATMLESYQTREGVERALAILSERALSPELMRQALEDTMSGSPGAKRQWTERGMTLDIRKAVGQIEVLTVVIVGDADRVENERTLTRELVARVRGAKIVVLRGVGHLSLLEAPTELIAVILKILRELD